MLRRWYCRPSSWWYILPALPCSARIQAWSARLSLAWLSLLVLLLVGCSELPGGQSANSNLDSTYHAAAGKLTYVAIGASDTFGIGTNDPYTQNWASDLTVELGPRVHLINLGIPGVLVHDALNLEVPIALDTHPDLITIWLAVNDIVAKVPVNSYSHDLDLLVSRLQAGVPHAIIAVANVPDLAFIPRFSKLDPLAQQVLYTQMLDYNAAIAAIVKRHHTILVDLSQQGFNLKNHPEYISGDGFHPNDIGYLQLAELFYQALPGTLRREGKTG